MKVGGEDYIGERWEVGEVGEVGVVGATDGAVQID